MNRNKTGIVIFTMALILVAFFVGCDDFIDRKNFLVTAEKVPYIRSIGFTKADNTKLGEDCFTTPLSTDEIVRITLPPGANVFSNLTISFTMNMPETTLNEWDGKQWVPWTSGKTLVSFSDLEDTKHLKAQYFFPYTKKTYEREYIFQLSKPIWLRLKEWKPDFYNDNGQNVVLYLRLIDQEGNDLDADRAKNGTWQSGDGIDIGYNPDELAILNYPPTYDVLRSVFPLNVKPFANGKLTITFPDGLFKDKHGSLASGYEVSFNFDASWIDKQNTVTFDSNGGSPASTDVTAVYGRTITLPAAQKFSRGNSLLEGWYYDKDIFLKEFDESSRVTGDITVYAKWVSDTAPGVPTNVRAVPDSNHVLLFWVPPLDWGLINDEFASSITYSINVYEAGNMGTVVDTIASTTDTMAKITNLKAGTDYAFDISASNGGSIPSLATRIWTKTNGVSGKPENLQISSSASTASADKAQVELRWEEPVDTGSDGGSAATISSYTVYYSENILTGADLAGVPSQEITNPPLTEITIDGLSSQTPYYFKVTATNSAGLESEAADIPVTTALSDNDAVAIAKADLSIPLPDLSQVMNDFTLPVSGANSTTITWTIVSGTGLSLSGTNSRDATVSSPNSGSEDVQLQATISRGNGSDTKTFDLTIIPASTKTDTDAVKAALAALDHSYMHFASGEDKDNVKSDFTLLTTGIEGTTLKWAIASGTAVLITQRTPSTAAVTRPDNSDTTVEFEVTVSKDNATETSTLSITVLKKDNIDKHITFTVKDISIAAGESGTHSLGLITALLPGDYSLSIEPPTMSIDKSGIITIGPAISSADAGTYTVRARGAGPNYSGETTANFELTVSAKSLSAVPGFVIEVDNKSVTALTGGQQHKATVKGGLTPATDYSLSISPDANGNIRIDNDGVITIEAGIKVSDAGDYTITATGQSNYPGTVEGVFNLTVNPKTLTTSILGTISNPSTDFEIQAGFTQAITRALGFSSPLRANSDYTLAITGSPPDAASGHVSLDSSTGQLTFSPDIVPDDSGTYSVTVYAMGDYSDPATPLKESFKLTVTGADISSITYSPVTANYETAMAVSASPAIEPADAAAGASFTISPDLNTNTGLSFDSATGAISGTPTIRASGDYTVTMEGGDGTKYEGTRLTSAQFSVTIGPKPIEGTLSYTGGSSIDTSYGTAQAISVQWASELPGQTVSYGINPTDPADPPLPGDIDFMPSNGALSVSGTTAVHTGTYTITASGTGDYMGTKEAQVSIRVAPKDLSQTDLGAISNSPFEVSTGSGSPFVETLRFDGPRILGSDYSVSITSYPGNADQSRVTLDSSGELTIANDVLLSEAGEYTVTAAGTGNYAGTATAVFTLNVQAADLTSVRYGGQPLAAVYDTAITPLTATVEPAAAVGQVDFSIDPGFSGDTGLSFATDSGRITGTPNKRLAQTDYTVTITGKTGTIYEGSTKTASIQVSVEQKDIADTAFVMTFADKSDAVEGAAASHSTASFATGGLNAAADYELTIAGPGGAAVPAVTIDNNGDISIDKSIVKGNTGLYTVTATGMNNYTGSKTAAFTLTVRRKITGISFTRSTLSLMPGQTMKELTPTLTMGTGTRPDDNNIAYSISPDLNANTGLTFDTDTGTISGKATAESPSTTYTITVVPDAGHYTSTAAARIDIEVTEALSASYSPIAAAVNTAISRSGPTLNNAGWTGTYSAALPSGLIINASNGEITGTPTTKASATDYTVNLTGTNSYLGVNAAATVSITVNPRSITVTYNNVTAQETVGLTSSPPVVDPANAKLSYLIQGKLPDDLKVNQQTGAIEGTPAAGTNQGLTEYTILVSGTGDWQGSTTTATVQIEIETAPAITASYSAIEITVQDTVDAMPIGITPSGSTATFMLAAGQTLPAGLILETDGRISGTATAVSPQTTYTIKLTGTGGSQGQNGTAQVAITVKPKAITSVSYDDIKAVYDTAITTVAPTKDPTGLTATYSSSDLPPGLSLNSAGEISGTPIILQTKATASTINIEGTGNWAGRTYAATVNITIEPKALSDVSAPSFSIAGSESVTALTGGSATATVTGGLTPASDYTLSIDKGGSSVAAVTINDDGAITIAAGITVSDAGNYTITATGQNNYTGTKTGVFTLSVDRKALEQADLGTISNSPISVPAGSSVIKKPLGFNGTGIINSDYSVGITAPSGANPSHVSINSATGELTISADIMPNDAGTYTVTATGKGNYTGTATAAFQLDVSAASVSISYSAAPLTASYGTGITALTPSPTYNPGEVSYSISPNLNADTGLDFDTDTGKISGTPTSILNAADYTVTIKGKDGTKYDGAADSIDVNVTVNRRDITGTLSYTADIDTPYGTEQTVNPQWTNAPTDQTLSYAIDPLPLPRGITFVQQTGALSVSNLAAASVSGTYTVTATGTGNYKESQDVGVVIRVQPKDLSTTGISISGSAAVTALTAGTAAATIDSGGLKAASDYSLSITAPNSNSHVSIANNGQITIGSGITVNDAGSYTITAAGQGNYTGDVTGSFTLTVNKKSLTSALLGSVNNPSSDFTIQAGFMRAITKTLNFSGSLTIDTDYTLAITDRPPDAEPGHLSLDAATGQLTLSTDIVPDDSGFYTVTAVGQNSYEGRTTASFRLNVASAAISISYSALTANYDTYISAVPTLTAPAVSTDFTYSISPDLNADTGLDFDTDTGEISGAPTNLLGSTVYTVTIEGRDGSKYEGSTASPTVTIEVKEKNISGILSYSNIDTTYGAEQTVYPQWAGEPQDQTVSYAIDSKPDDIIFLPDSGALSVSSGTAAHTGSYKITARGTGNYTGDITFTTHIDISPKSLTDVAGFSITDLRHTVTALSGDSAKISIINAGLTHTDDYALSILPDANGNILIDDEGAITITNGITVSDDRIYTIIATGQGNYRNQVTGIFDLTVNSKELTSDLLGSISNPASEFEIQAGFANPITRTLRFGNSLTVGKDYTIDITGRPQGAEESHVSLNANTGELTLSTAIVPDDSGEYTLTVSAKGNYTDPATPLAAAFRLTVTKADISSITYSPVSAVYETAMAQSVMPTIVPADAAIGASFTISPSLNTNTGLNFDPATGAISGTPTKRDTGNYSVRIEGGDGTKYEGSTLTSAGFSVTIDRKPIEGTLSYTGGNIGNIDTSYGTAQELSVRWTGELSGHTVSYAIAPTDSADPALPGDITFVESTGALSVRGTTAVHTGSYTITASGTGDYTGTKEAQVSIDVAPKNLIQTELGGITNSPFTVSAGSGSSAKYTLIFSGSRVLGDDYSVSIKNRPTGADETRVTLTDTGELTIASDVLLSEAGNYTVEAAGKGNYGGTATATFTLNVQAAALTSISYGGQPLAAVYKTAITDLTATVEPAAAADKVDFSIDPSLNSDTGLSFDTNSGLIFGTPTKLLTQKSYTVTITGETNTIYEGETKDVSIQVSVAQKDIADTSFAMTFDDKSDANEGAVASHSAASFETDGLSAAADYELSIAGPGGAAVPAVTIDNSGNISIGSGIDKSNTGEYSVTATGINNYTGTVGAAFTLTVRREITGISFTSSTLSLMPDQKMTDLTPTLKAGTGIQPDDDNISYSIDPDLNAANIGLTFDTATGTISGTATKAAAAQDYTITVVPDAGHYTSTATATVDIEVTEALSASYSNIDATVNTAITTAGPTVNNAGWTGTFSEGSPPLPDGLTINTSNGNIDGDPTIINSKPTDYTVNLTGTGSYLGVDATATVTITVNPKPITSVTYNDVTAQETVKLTASPPLVIPSGAKLTYSLAQQINTLPSGLKVNADTGAIEGTPVLGTTQSSQSYMIEVSGTGDWQGSTTSVTVWIEINAAPKISAGYKAIEITVQETVNEMPIGITPVGNTADFALASGQTLPTGLILETDGRISGTATVVSPQTTYTIELTGTGGSLGRNGTAQVAIVVKAKALTSVSYADINAVYDTDITTVTPTKNPSGLTATYSSANLPTGLTVNSGNGEISGKPTVLQTTKAESTISIIGTGDWEGRSYNAKVNITIGPKALSDVSGFSISGSETVTALTGGSATATVAGGLTPTSDYILSIDKGGSSVAAVTINNAGKITIDSTITVSDAGTYTITAAGQGNYTGTKTGTFTLTVGQKALVQADLGSITNSPISITAGSGSVITRTLNFNGALAGGIGTDYTVGITAPSGAVASRVSLNSNTGELTISADIVPDDSGPYTVTATGQGNYSGTTSATFKLNVTAASLSISYHSDTYTGTYSTVFTTQFPSLNVSSVGVVHFNIDRDLNGETGLNFDTFTGKIYGTPTKSRSSTDYKVTITGRNGTKYEGASDSFTVNITVNKRNVGTLSYSRLETTYGTEKTVNPSWTPHTAEVNYSITPSPLPSGVTFVNSTGALSVSNLAAVSVSGTYKITATGTGNYTGSKFVDVIIDVTSKELSTVTDFSFADLSHTVTALTGGQHKVSVNGGLNHLADYSLSIAKKITGGTVPVAAVSINNDGTITIGSGITVSDAGDYTITATGQGNYSGTVTGTFNLTVNPKTLTSALLGTINNQPADFAVSAGITSKHTKTLSFTGPLTAGTDFTLAITNRPTGAKKEHVKLTDTGDLTVTTDVVPDDEGTYTVTATGQGNYGSTTTASFTLSITPAGITSIKYDDVKAVYDTAMTAAVEPTVDPADAATGASFTISPDLKTNTGLDFNPATGAISGMPSKRVSGNYTVTIRGGDGTKYQGATKTSAQFSVTIDQKPIEGTLSYTGGNIDTTYGTEQALSASWTPPQGQMQMPYQEVTYTIAPTNTGDPALPSDITFTPGTGALSVTNYSAVHTGHYTITASGTGDYTGTRTVDVSITVSQKTLTAAGFTIGGNTGGNTGSVTALTGGQPTVGIGGNLKPEDDYSLSISPDANGRISIDNSGNITIDSGIEVSDAGDYTITATGQGNYSGTVTGTFSLTVKPKTLTSALLGVIDNLSADFEVSAGITGNHIRTLSFDGTLSIGTDYSLVIKTRPQDATVSHVSLDSSTGELTVTTDVVPDDAGVYTVEASGQGNYTNPVNPVTAAFTLTVTKLGITSVTYNPVTAIYDTSMTAAVGPTVDPDDAADKVSYSINSQLTSDTGLDFSTATGEISGTPDKIPPSSKNYTVTIAGKDGTKYEGSSTTTTVNVAVNRKSLADVSGFSVSVDNHSTTATIGSTHSATVVNKGLTPGTDYDLSITGSGVTSGVVSIYNDGNIGIKNTIASSDAGTYTVKASGKGKYTGEVTDTFTLTVKTALTPALLGSINNSPADFTIQAGFANNITRTLTFTGSLTHSTDYTLAITGRPQGVTDLHVSMNSTSAVLVVWTNIVPDHSGEYTVTATGEGKYSGKTEVTFNLAVTAAPVSISYDSTALTATYDIGISSLSPSSTYNFNEVSYSIDPDLNADTGLVFSTDTGEISGTPKKILLNATEYTVTISGTEGTKYDGATADTTVRVTVNKRDIAGTLKYDGTIDTIYTTAKTVKPVWTDELPGQTVAYSISPTLPNDIIFTTDPDPDPDAGALSVSNTTSVHTETYYTITAEGTGNYTGNISTTMSIKVSPKDINHTDFKFAYSSLVVNDWVRFSTTPKPGFKTDGLIMDKDFKWSAVVSPVQPQDPLKPLPSGVDASHFVMYQDGGLVIKGSASAAAPGEIYDVTIKATGINNYYGEISDDLQLTINGYSVGDLDPDSPDQPYQRVIFYKASEVKQDKWTHNRPDTTYRYAPDEAELSSEDTDTWRYLVTGDYYNTLPRTRKYEHSTTIYDWWYDADHNNPYTASMGPQRQRDYTTDSDVETYTTPYHLAVGADSTAVDDDGTNLKEQVAQARMKIALSLGSGKSNTEILMAQSAENIVGPKDMATVPPYTGADLCGNLNVGGKDDWFLPSLGELERLKDFYVANETNNYFDFRDTNMRYQYYVTSSILSLQTVDGTDDTIVAFYYDFRGNSKAYIRADTPYPVWPIRRF